MKTTVRVLLMSQLSDVQVLIETKKAKKENEHLISYMKHIIAKFPNTNTEIDADEEYKRFLKTLMK
jgi:hypothetical protein